MQGHESTNSKLCSIHFFGSLKDFLKKHQANPYPVSILSDRSVKDAIESAGIPHVEVGAIYVNDVIAHFNDLLVPQSFIKVYPILFENDRLDDSPLRPGLPTPRKFILDVHLGSLSRLLRLMGFDTVYSPMAEDLSIAQQASTDKRIVLTRDIGLLKYKIIEWGYWLRSQQTEEQFREIVKQFDLGNLYHPFSRCISCNGRIAPVEKATIANQIPPNTVQYFDQFFQCLHCSKIYWKGSHYKRMLDTLQRLAR